MAQMKFLGVPYPITRSALGFLRSSNGIDQIKSDLLQLLLTTPGERVMLPTYGTPLKKLIFDPNDTNLELAAREMIINSINQWEPRITVQQIEITSSINPNQFGSGDPKENLENFLFIRILFFDPENIQEVEELKLELPVSGGQ
jgi:phage baseplate assembly protein W